MGRDSYADTTLSPDSWRGRHVDVRDKHPEAGQGRPSTTRAHAWAPQRAPHVSLPSTIFRVMFLSRREDRDGTSTVLFLGEKGTLEEGEESGAIY